MNHFEIRSKFFDFFQKKGHTSVPSSSLIPQNDPSLLFVNAGMNPFKNIFLGLQKPSHSKITSIQKCLRVGGKHNDLEQVGHSPSHHTFFEMMGNFSFGDYFKKEAIEMAWEFLTETLNIPKERLWVSVFEKDKETYSLWKETQNLNSDRIFKQGEEDNFWRMGNEGPCGPCSEIYYYKGSKPQSVEDMTEIWNLVFMEFYEDASGQKKPLPKLCVDTGVGIERLASVLQNTSSNYQTNLFSPIISSLESASGVSYKKEQIAFQIIADHSRAITFLISDGIIPGNEGQNYVLRRLLRRAFHYNQKLSEKKNLLQVATEQTISQMEGIYPELKAEKNRIQNLIEEEKEKFFSSLHQGRKILLKKMKASSDKVIDASTTWDLYSTYGFPFDLTRLIAQEKGYQMNVKTEEEMFKQNQTTSFKKGNPMQNKISSLQLQKIKLEKTLFTGYEKSKEEALLSQIFSLDLSQNLQVLKEGEEAWCVTTQTCFYPEGGGQVGDQGTLQTETGEGFVSDCQKQGDMIFHKIKVLKGSLKSKQKTLLFVNLKHRSLTAGSHSATHLLHAALRETLGSSVRQAGSLVEAGRLRFDFTHSKPLSPEQVKIIEQKVQKGIEDHENVSPSFLPYKQALEEGALSMAGENYPKKVRVIQMKSLSKELCGGIHVSNTSEIGSFKIVSETGVQSGIRRIEAYTGIESLKWLGFLAEENLELRNYFKIPHPKTKEDSSPLFEKIKKIEQELKSFKMQLKQVQTSEEAWEETSFSKNSSLFILKSPVSDRKILSEIADKKKSQKSSIVIVFGQSSLSYPVIVTVSKDLQNQFSAHQILKEYLIPSLKGKGGGQARFAQGEVQKIENLKKAVEDLIKNLRAH